MALTTCPDCQAQISTAALACPRCGRPMREAPTPAKPAPSPGVAAVLSLVIPGAGQMYRGDVGQGLAWLVVVVIGYLLFIVPGLILHLICVITAASNSVSVAPAPAQRPLTPQERQLEIQRAKKDRSTSRVIMIVFFIVLAVIATMAVLEQMK